MRPQDQLVPAGTGARSAGSGGGVILLSAWAGRARKLKALSSKIIASGTKINFFIRSLLFELVWNYIRFVVKRINAMFNLWAHLLFMSK